MNNITEIPQAEDWGDWESDPDLKYAHKIFFGKTNKEAQEDFYRCVIERADELKVMRDNAFRYYMLGFRDFILADNFMPYDSADAASCFLNVVESKLTNFPDDIKLIMNELYESIVFVSNNQSKFDADESIYGNFQEQLSRIEKLIN